MYLSISNMYISYNQVNALANMIMLSSSINFWMGTSFEFVQFYQSENLFMDIYTQYNNKEMDSKIQDKMF